MMWLKDDSSSFFAAEKNLAENASNLPCEQSHMTS
jgi:hypothetical protein